MRLICRGRQYFRLILLAGHFLAGLIAANMVLRLGRVSDHTRQRLSGWWMRQLCRILNVRITVKGKIDPGNTLYVANHISWLDIPVMMGVINTRFVAKQEVRQWPVIGFLAASAGTLFLQRGNHDSTARTSEQITWSLVQGNNVCVFPEGTSTNGNSVRRFYPRLFQPAQLSHGKVQAITVNYPQHQHQNPLVPFIGDAELLQHLWRLLAERTIEAELIVHPTIEASRYTRDQLAEVTHRQISAALHGTKPSQPADQTPLTSSM